MRYPFHFFPQFVVFLLFFQVQLKREELIIRRVKISASSGQPDRKRLTPTLTALSCAEFVKSDVVISTAEWVSPFTLDLKQLGGSEVAHATVLPCAGL